MFFNGLDLSNYLRIKEIRGRGITPYEINLLNVQGKTGAYFDGIERKDRVLEIDANIISNNREEMYQKIDVLNGVLSVNEPVPIQLPGEENKTYYGIPAESSEDEEFFFMHKGTLVIICPDPHKYGNEIETTSLTIENEGTAKADPIFKLDVLAPITFATVQNQNGEYMMIGQPIDVDSITFQEKELILSDPMDSTVGWTTGTQIDNGTVSGTMASSGSEFVVSDWGAEEGTAKWYGPALKKSLSEQLQDFQVDIRVQNIDEAEQVGRVEMYLLDVNDNIIGRITLKDAWTDYSRNRGEARAGSESNGHYLLREDYAGSWHDFRGMLRLERIGNQWTSYIAKIDETGKHRSRETRRFTDTENKYMEKVAQVQVSIAKFGTYESTQSSIYDLKVWKLNDPSQFGIPYIADAGDEITFDHKEKLILINGEPRKDLKQFGASYFGLYPGYNQLSVMPSDSFNITSKYQEKFK